MDSIQEKIKKSIRTERESVNDPNAGCLSFCSPPIDTFSRDVEVYNSCCKNKDIYPCCDEKCVLTNFPIKGPVGGEDTRRDILNQMRFQSSRNPTIIDQFCSGFNIYQTALGPGGERVLQEGKKSGGVDREGKIIPYCKSKKRKITDPNDPNFGQEVDIPGALEADPVFACACDERYGNCGEAEDYETCVMAKSKDILRCLRDEKKLEGSAFDKAIFEFDRMFCSHKDDATPCRPCFICKYLTNVNPDLAQKIDNPDYKPSGRRLPSSPTGPSPSPSSPTGPSPSPSPSPSSPTGPSPFEPKPIEKKILPSDRSMKPKKPEGKLIKLSETTKISLTVGGIILISFIILTISYFNQGRRGGRR